jgi:hypothetical protein
MGPRKINKTITVKLEGTLVHIQRDSYNTYYKITCIVVCLRETKGTLNIAHMLALTALFTKVSQHQHEGVCSTSIPRSLSPLTLYIKRLYP